MAKMRLRLRTMTRSESSDDESEAQHLVGAVRAALARGGAAPVAVMLRGEQVYLVPLAPIAQQGMRIERFVAGLSRSTMEAGERVDAVGVMGMFRTRQGKGPPVPIVQVFLEWPDNRWWHWKALVQPDGGELREDSETISTAADGDAMPAFLGRWWSLGRRLGFKVHFEQGLPEAEEAPEEIVH